MTHTVLVTGGGGFIGEHCLRRLAATGAIIHATTTRSGTGQSGPVSWHTCDLLDPAACARVMDEVRPTHLLHLAWIATPGAFWTSRENLRWLEAGCALIDAFYAQGGRRAVGAGTCAEYLWQNEPYVEERTPLRPDTVYGQCKRAMGLAFEAAAAAHGASQAWARLFFPYGPGEPPGRIIPSVIRSLLRGEPVDCTHGQQVRDFVYVEDAAAALVALLECEAPGAYNVGSGSGSTLKETISRIAAVLGRPELVRWGVRPAPAADPPFVVADMSKLSRLGAWHPAVAIGAGLERTIAAWRAREHV